jgi:hypothetical protein
MHLGSLPQLGCFLMNHRECLQFNIKRGHISKTSCNMWGHHTIVPFVHAFYAFESPLFYSHYNRDGDVTVIPSTMGIRQGDSLGGALFSLVHLKALHYTINHFPCRLFPSIANDIHITTLFPLYPLHMNIFRFNSVQ